MMRHSHGRITVLAAAQPRCDVPTATSPHARSQSDENPFFSFRQLLIRRPLSVSGQFSFRPATLHNGRAWQARGSCLARSVIQSWGMSSQCLVALQRELSPRHVPNEIETDRILRVGNASPHAHILARTQFLAGKTFDWAYGFKYRARSRTRRSVWCAPCMGINVACVRSINICTRRF